MAYVSGILSTGDVVIDEHNMGGHHEYDQRVISASAAQLPVRAPAVARPEVYARADSAATAAAARSMKRRYAVRDASATTARSTSSSTTSR